MTGCDDGGGGGGDGRGGEGWTTDGWGKSRAEVTPKASSEQQMSAKGGIYLLEPRFPGREPPMILITRMVEAG